MSISRPKSKNIEDTYPLTPMQEGMLFHSLYAPESGVYITQVTCTLGNLNVLALEQAWQEVIDRHPILRTAFVWENLKKPLQVVGRRVGAPWERQDWRGLSETEQEERFSAYLKADRGRGFKLSSAPLMRLALFQLSKDTYKFVWSHHHILLDGWSVHLLINEVASFYACLRQGQNIRRNPSRPYRDYIAWLQRQDQAAAERFWRESFKGFTTPTPLSVDREIGTDLEERYGDERIGLSVPTTAALQNLARSQKLTLNTVAQGVWAILLSRYSGEEDVVFGNVVSGRPPDLTGVESMIGLFINTLPVRVEVSPEASLLPWLKKLQEQQVEMRRYEYSPLVQVQRVTDVPRGLPMFESLFTFENYPVDHTVTERDVNLDARDYCVIERNSFPLAFVVGQGSELTLRIIYDRRRFDAATIDRMLGHFQNLVEGVIGRQEQRISDLPMVTAAEQRRLLKAGTTLKRM
jgi:surfactin family lipopeptide synthetase C